MFRHAKRLLIVSYGDGALARLLRSREGVELRVIEPSSQTSAQARAEVDATVVPDWGTIRAALPDGYLDAVILNGVHVDTEPLRAALANAAPLLSPNGFVLFATADATPQPAESETSTDIDTESDTLGLMASDVGLEIYDLWDDHDAASGDNIASPRERLVMAVPRFYNPLQHARNLFLAGHQAWSYCILSTIPAQYRRNPQTSMAIDVDLQFCLLAWAKNAEPRKRLELFFNAQSLFYQVVSTDPRNLAAYRCHAEFWRLMGNDDMAARMLSSVQLVVPSEDVTRQLSRYRPETTVQPPDDETTPDFASTKPTRILFITHERPHYGLDVLYDGLCEVLGDENVTEYPYKPLLHGRAPETLAHYPCACDRQGEALSLDDLLRALETGRYDAVVYGDIEQGIDERTTRRIMDAAAGLPLFILDQQDDPMDNRPKAFEHMGSTNAHAYFKREMLACFDYGPNTYPLPFAYGDHRVPSRLPDVRTQLLFWAGHRKFGLRRLYLERLEESLNTRLDKTYAQEQYTEAMRSSEIGLNLFGFGFDTVRYWEIPANGCMLLSERVPIRIPHNFVDGDSAVFFDDLADLEQKLAHYMNNPCKARAIAMRGYAHLLKHHTGSARARQMLGWMSKTTGPAGL